MTGASLRADLFARVESIAAVLRDDVEMGDELRRLPDTTIAAIRGARLHALKVPAVMGGFEAEPALQFEVFERVAFSNAAAAWCLFIYADTIGMLGARLPDAGLAQLFPDGDVPIVCGGGGLRPGVLTPEPGGFRLKGRFRYGSGIDAASSVMVSGYVPGEARGAGHVRLCVVPRADVDVADTWHVLGMRATGSHDYTIDDVFVPAELTAVVGEPPCRGGRQYRTGTAGYLGFTIPAIAIAIARRALDALVERAPSATRGYARPTTLTQRATFHSFVGEADQKLKAAKALMLRCGEDLMERIDARDPGLRAFEAEIRAAGAYTVRTATDVLADTVRFAGGEAHRTGGIFERSLRDLTTVSSHLLVSESAYENHAQFLLGLPDADPMG
jgi:indole-3-acetate monooxygenase